MSGDVLTLDRPQDRFAAENPPAAVVPGRSAAGAASVAPVIAEPHRAADLLELTKPRIVTMILIVTTMAAVVAAGWDLQILTVLHLIIGTALVAGSSGVLNQVLEREVDGRMARTRFRPLPDDRIGAFQSSLFGLLLLVAGSAYLAFFLGMVPAAVGLATWLLYVTVYTPLKTRTAWNTTVGAVAGALPMLIGYTAAGGSLADVRGWLLFGVLLWWQYPHFMAIAWMYRYDYGVAGLRMTSVVEPTGRSAGRQAVAGVLLLMLTLVALVAPGSWGWGWSLAVVAVTVPFVVASFRFARRPDDLTARRLLRASLFQLPAAMIVLVISSLI